LESKKKITKRQPKSPDPTGLEVGRRESGSMGTRGNSRVIFIDEGAGAEDVGLKSRKSGEGERF